jgi:RHS repeat-associated protein
LLRGNGDGSFNVPLRLDLPTPNYETGPISTPHALVVGLLDNDNIPDIVYSNYDSGYLSLSLSSNSTSNPLQTIYFPQQGPTAIAIGDINGDGHNDLALANGLDNTVSIWFNNGDGNFTPSQTSYAVGALPQDLTFGDLNQDGFLDLVVADANGNEVSVLFNQGNGTFANAVAISAGRNPYALAVGDINHDGLLDIVTANYLGGFSTLTNQGNGTFATDVYGGAGYTTTIPFGVGGTSIALGDIDKDGALDVVTTHSNVNYRNTQTSVWLNQGNGSFGSSTAYTVGLNPQAVAIGDIDKDGNSDIVTVNSGDGSATVLLGSGTGTFDPLLRQDFAIGGYAGSLALSDLDKDGYLDFVTQNFKKDPSSNRIYSSLYPTSFFNSSAGRSNLYIGHNYHNSNSGTLNQPQDNRTVGDYVRYTYDPIFNKVISKTDELGHQMLYKLDPITGNIVSQRQVVGLPGGADDLITRYTYTAQGQTDLEIDPLGHVTDNDYDVQGRLIKVTTAKGTSDEAVQQYEYDASGNRIAMIDENGNRTTYVYDSLNRLVQEIKADPDGTGLLTSPITRYEYDAEGNQTAVTDSRGYTTHYEYDALDRATNTTNALGAVTSNEYDRAGNLVATTDELGRRTQYRYDSRNRQIESIDPEGGRTQYLYDANDNQIAEIDALGRRTNSVYDARNRLIRTTDPLNGSTTYVYDAVGNLIVQTDPNGHQTKFTYDDLNRRIKTTDALGNVETSSYDKDGNLITKTDALGQITTFTYDNRNRMIATVNALGDRISMTYDRVGNLLSRTDELNRTTTYRYDALNRQISVTDPLAHTTSYTYDSEGNQVAITDALNRSTTYAYDALNRQVGMTDALGGTRTMAYDAVGNLIAQTDELNRTSAFNYDSRNWLITTTDPLSQLSTKTYDAVGNVLTTADALGHTTSYGYDALNRKVSTIDALGQATLLTYDSVGNLLRLTDPDQNTTTYTYDVLSRQLTDTNELGLSRTYVYNAVGKETSMVDRNGRKTIYTYDALNRQIQENWLDASGNPIRITNHSYDAASQLKSVSDPDSRYGYTYDLAGRLTGMDNTGTLGVPIVVLGYTYDAVNNRLTTTDTINGQLKGTETYTYDALNRTTRITQNGNGVSDKRVDMAYDAASQMTGIERYADLLGTQSVANSDYSYDLAGRLTRLTHRSNSTTYSDYQWTYDAANRITQFVSSDGTSNYNYDHRDQLTNTDHNYQADEAYSYDANGNRTNARYQTGQDNRLLNDGIYSYAYDNEGNRTSRTILATGEVTSYEWDYHNRLTGVTTKNSNGTVTKAVGYTYDAYNRRIAKSIDADGSGPATAVTEQMVYDRDNIALTFDGQGTVTHQYLFGPGVDRVLADETQTSINWSLVDNLGTVRDVIDSNGIVLNHLTYDSFGQVISETNSNIDFRYGYTGRERDEETGLDYYRTRYYDSVVGRFISEDTIGFKGGDTNLYRYVSNSPISNTDPFGQEQEPWWGRTRSVNVDPNDPIFDSEERFKLDVAKARAIAKKLRTEYGGWKDVLPDCPCTEEKIKRSSDFSEEGFKPVVWIFHHGAESSYRSKPREYRKGGQLISRPGQQCTYKKGKLITSEPGAGSPDFWSPGADFVKHQQIDVWPWLPLGWSILKHGVLIKVKNEINLT